MGSRVDIVQYICDQAGLGRRLTYRKMFGEYALYLDAKVVALVCDDQLFLKPTPEGRKFLGVVSEASPYPGAKNFYLLSAVLDDTETLRGALLVTASALPEPRPKPARSRARTKAVKKKRSVAK